MHDLSFYFMRHGQTDWNKEHRGMGQTDIPLNAVGMMQAHAASKNLTHLQLSKIVSSPLTRAMQTSEIIASALNIPITIVDDFKECSWGIMEGRDKGDGEWIQYWKAGDTIEGAEQWATFVARIKKALTAVLADTVEEEPLLIVAHGGVYWAMQEILQLKADGDIPNCCPVFLTSAARDRWTSCVVQNVAQELSV